MILGSNTSLPGNSLFRRRADWIMERPTWPSEFGLFKSVWYYITISLNLAHPFSKFSQHVATWNCFQVMFSTFCHWNKLMTVWELYCFLPIIVGKSNSKTTGTADSQLVATFLWHTPWPRFSMSCFTACWSPFLAMKVQVSENSAAVVSMVPCTFGTSAKVGQEVCIEAGCLYTFWYSLKYMENAFISIFFPFGYVFVFFSPEGQSLWKAHLLSHQRQSLGSSHSHCIHKPLFQISWFCWVRCSIWCPWSTGTLLEVFGSGHSRHV